MRAALLLGVVFALLAVSEAGIRLNFNIHANSVNHKTDKYRAPSGAPQRVSLIVRLWQPFTIYASAGQFDSTWTYALKDCLSSSDKQPIKLKLVRSDASSVTVAAETNFIGRYYFQILDNSGKQVFLSNTQVFLLFNPWNAKDETYAGSHANDTTAFAVDLKEYVLNEKGAVWQGCKYKFSFTPWAYNHLDLNFLNTTIQLLAPLKTNQRDVMRVSRYMTVAEQSVLYGRWDGNYDDGKVPWFWTSSSAIVDQFRETNQPVKYGQCWVFSSLYTALARTLGIPTNSVTNLGSAHEPKRNGKYKQICEMHYTATSSGGFTPADGSTCSIWNFHVWNNVWFAKRGDRGTPGWQAVDATPQETSTEGPQEAPFTTEDYYTGPVALDDLYNRKYTAQFDAGFVGGEVNALVINYNCANGKCTETDRDPNSVGSLMLAKGADSYVNTAASSSGYSSVWWVNWGPKYNNRKYTRLSSAQSAGAYGSFLEADEELAGSGSSSSHPSSQSSFHAIQSQSLQSAIIRKNNLFKAVIPDFQLGKKTEAALGPAADQHPTGRWGYFIQVYPVDYKDGHPVSKTPLLIKRAVVDFSKSKHTSLVVDFPASFWVRKTVLEALERTNYFQVIYSASSPDGIDPWFKRVDVEVSRPQLAVLCSDKPSGVKHVANHTQGDTIHCTVKFYHSLGSKEVPLTKPRVKLTVTGQSSKEERRRMQEQKEAKPKVVTATDDDKDENGNSLKGTETLVFDFNFRLMGEPGKQIVTAIFTSKQIRNVRGANVVTIKANPQAVSQQSERDSQESKSMGRDAHADMGQQATGMSRASSSHSSSGSSSRK